MLKRFEILQELPKCGTQTQSEHMLWESAAARLLVAGATDLPLVKNAVTANLMKRSTIKHGVPLCLEPALREAHTREAEASSQEPCE